jgi:hypothetical protein
MPHLWLPDKADGSVVLPESFGLRWQAAPFSVSTQGPLEATLLDAGEGTEADFAKLGAKARGAIALVHNREMKTFDDLCSPSTCATLRWLPRRRKPASRRC